MEKRIKPVFLPALIISISLIAGCSNSGQEETPSAAVTPPVASETVVPDSDPTDPALPDDTEDIGMTMEIVPLATEPAMFELLLPAAPGTDVLENAKAAIDVSNKQDGYVMVKYLEATTKELRVRLKGPSGTIYTYVLKPNGEYEVYPLSDGSGSYEIGVFEAVGGGKYSTALSGTISVELTDEFAPFLRPNQYVNYNADNEAVAIAAKLTKGTDTMLDKIAAIYQYVVKNITYDKELAANVKSGYLPDIDAVLASGKGICFDYAAVMTAMLRSQGIPTKLVVGYTGNAYHAWINTYSEETGWMDSVIYFDGTSWKLMDPTFASSGGESSEVMEYIGDGKNYQAKYLY